MVQIVRTEIRRRGFLGKLVKFGLITFNILMIIWLVSYWSDVSSTVTSEQDKYARAGAAIGTTLGTTFILFFWAAGDVILGLFVLFTRGKKIIIEEREQ